MKRNLLIVAAFVVLAVSLTSIANATSKKDDDCRGRWNWHECDYNTPTPRPTKSPKPTPTVEPSTTPEPTVTPTEGPKFGTGPAPRPECRKMDWAPSIFWYWAEGNTVQASWSAVSEYIDNYLVEYEVDGVVYNTIVLGPNVDIKADNPITRIRVSGYDKEGGCHGPFSVWTNSSKAAGGK